MRPYGQALHEATPGSIPGSKGPAKWQAASKAPPRLRSKGVDGFESHLGMKAAGLKYGWDENCEPPQGSNRD